MNISIVARLTEQMLIGFFAIALVALILAIIYYVGYWCLLQKMGRHDFAALGPGYGLWEYARGAGLGCGLATFMLLALIASMACGDVFVATFGYDGFWEDFSYAFVLAGDNGAGAVRFALDLLVTQFTRFNPLLYSCLIFAAIYIVLYLYASYGVARSFGHGIGFTLGLVILPIIFIPILGGSRNQKYSGPYLDRNKRPGVVQDWAGAVEARVDAFGSNAPLALALMGMVMSATLMTLPGIVISLIALVRNRQEKAKPLSRPKHTATTIIGWLGILIGVGMLALLLVLGGLANVMHEAM